MLGHGPLSSSPISGAYSGTLPPSTFEAQWAIFEDDFMLLKRNTASQVVGCQMINAADGSAFTGTASVSVTLDGGVQGAGGGSVTHEGNGYHTYLPTQAETNANLIGYTFTGTGAIPRTVMANGVAFDPFNATTLGLTNLDATVSSRLASASYTAPLDVAGTRAAIGLASANMDTQLSGIQTDTNDIQTRLPAALVSGRIDASVGAMATGVLTATAIAADAITAAKVAADVTTEIQSGLATAAALSAVDSNVSAILTDTGTTGVIVATNNDKTGYAIATGGIGATSFASGAITAAALAADAVDEILDEQIGDSTITVRQALKLMVATLGGKVSGAGTTTITFRNAADDTDVVVATVDGAGNRTAITRTL